MMLRPRLSRTCGLALLALATLLIVSYFPFSGIRAASTATILPSAGKPLVNLQNPQTLKVTYAGSAEATATLKNGTAIPTAMAAADFHANGATDVVAGYSTKSGGVLVLFGGNPDAYAPTDATLKALKGSVPPTFLPKATAFSLPESPDFIVTGDFNRDGYKDVLVAARGGSPYLLAGDGAGNLLAPQIVSLPGQVTAMAAAADGHVAIGFNGSNGAEVAILAPGTTGLTSSATYPLPAAASAVVWGNFGGGADAAVGAGSNIVMIYHALGTNPQTETVTVSFRVMGLAVGDYIWDQNGRTEIAALADDGSVQILQHGTLNTAPLTAAQIPGRRAAAFARAKAKQPSNPTALGAWTVASKLPYTGSAPAGPVSASAFSTPRLAQSSTHDVMVLDAGKSQLTILDTSGKTASPSSAVSFTGAPVAALALPQTANATRNLLVLTSAQAAPTMIPVPGSLTLNVNTNTDQDLAGACTTGSTVTSPPATLSLREAVCIANNNGATTTTINLPSDTYSLSISTFGGKGSASSSGELQVGIESGNNISIVGSGASSTIINQTNGKDRVIEGDELLAGNIPISLSSLTLSGGLCNDSSGLDCFDNGGGAILAGGTGDNLTITNVTMSNNSTGGDENGGAVTFLGPTLMVSSSTFSSNTAAGAGGAIYSEDGFFNGGELAGSISITDSTFTSDTAAIDGGAVRSDLYGGYNATISGSTFTGNRATGSSASGGAIYADTENNANGEGALTISNSRIVGNTAGGGGTGLSEAGITATAINNWWGCNGGPVEPGCDTVLTDAGSLSFNPWLELSIGASPTQVATGGTSTLTADLTHNSNGTGGFSVPNGTPVAFGATLGSDNPTSGTFASGQATSTFTAGATAGTGSGTATVDNQQVSTPIDVLVSVTVTTSPANLSITVDGVSAVAPQTYNWVVGSSHTIATTSPQNVSGGTEQVFSSWSDGGAISHTVTGPSSSITYTATFNTEYQLTTQASPAGDGSVTPTSGQYFASGASIPVTATANTGFTFNNWSATGGTFDSSTSASTSFHMPAAVTTVTGNFIPATTQITITTSPANLLVSADGGPFVAAPLVETWNQGSSHTIATESPQAGAAGTQDAWSSWSDGGAISHSITVTSTATTYTASFLTQYQLTTAANPVAGGTVSPTSGNYYNSGTVVPLTATPNVGYTFTNWTGNVANAGNASTTITMTAPQSVTANFSLIIVAAATTTSVASNNNPSFTAAPNNSVTFTATVTSNSTVNEGTVTFSDPANDFTCSGGNTVAVSNGQATCTTSFTTEGSRVIAAAYNGTVNFQGSSGNITQVANNHTVQNGNQFCNPGAITIPNSSGAATPYPSNIFVTGESGNIGHLTVTLNNIGSSDMPPTDLLLVGPTGAAIVPFASVGDGSTISGVNITLDDAAASLLPGGSPLTTGTFKPTSLTGSATLTFPAPAPTINASNFAATDGSATLGSEFNNTAPNGTWQLFAQASSANGAAAINGGWCVTITGSTAPTITSANSTTFTEGQFGSFPVTTTGSPTPSISSPGPFPSGVGIHDNGNGTATISGTPAVGSSSGSPYQFTITAANGVLPNGTQNFSLTVLPSTVQVMVGTSPTGLSFSVDSMSYTSTQTFTWNVGSPHMIATMSPQTPSTGVQDTWSSWSDGGAISHMVTAPPTPTTYTASFSTSYLLTTVASPSADGTVAPASGGYYASGATIPVTATANAGFAFSNWTSTGGSFDSTTAASTNFHMPAAPATVTGNFTSTAQPQVTLNPTSMNFGDVYLNSMVSQIITVRNTGNATLIFNEISLTGKNGGGEFRMQNSCPKSLAVGHTCQVEAFFTANQIGPRTNTLSFGDNAPGSPQQVGLTATVINPIASFNPTELEFGTVKQSHSKSLSVTITNTGTTPLTITGVGITGADMGDFVDRTNCTSLAPNRSCIASVTFTPTMTGSRSADLTVMGNSQTGTTNVPLMGTGD